MRRVAAILGAVACFVLAGVLLLTALDVARWQSALESDDVRYRAAPQEEDLWQPAQTVPFGAAEALGVADDVDFRSAAHAQARGRRSGGVLRPAAGAPAERGAVVDRRDRRGRCRPVAPLARDDAARGDQLRERALPDSLDQESLQRDALARFRGAIELEPENDEAKANLELALQATRRRARAAAATIPPLVARVRAAPGPGRPGRLLA